MRENINKVSQRGEHLDSLQDKTDNLAVSAQGFRRGANRVRKQMWWKDVKMRIWLIIGIIVLLIVIIVPAGASLISPSSFLNNRMLTSCSRRIKACQVILYVHIPPNPAAFANTLTIEQAKVLSLVHLMNLLSSTAFPPNYAKSMTVCVYSDN